MADWGITEYGFYRPTLAELIVEGQNSMKAAMGGNWNVGDNSHSGMLIKAEAGAQSKVWQALESVYYSQTKAGAEGKFLDERYTYFGISRRGATAGSGDALVETDHTATDVTEVVAGSVFSGTNGVQYKSTDTVSVQSQVKAYKIEGDSLAIGNYTFKVTTLNGTVHEGTYALTANDNAARATFFNNLKSFFDSIFYTETSKVLIDITSSEFAFYVGFTLSGGAYNPTGMSDRFQLSFPSNRIGNRFTEVNATATQTGYKPLEVGGILGVLPTPLGYVSTTNLVAFNSGSEVESDAEFNVKGENRSDTPRSSTRPSIVGNMLKVNGVVAFALDKTVDASGKVTNTPIVLGGSTADIAEELYRTQPVNNTYSGTTSYTVTTADSKTEVIKFTRATEVNRSVRVQYSPVNGNTLTDAEVSSIKAAVEAVKNNINIGGKVFNGQLEGAVFSTNPKRFLNLVVMSKEDIEPDSAYTSNDYTPLPSQHPVLSADRVEVVRV